MDAKWLLDLGWSVFSHAALRCQPGGSAEEAFRAAYAQQAERGEGVFVDAPELLGELLVWVSEAGRQAGLLAMRNRRDVGAVEVIAALDAVAKASDTTWCRDP